MPANEKKSFGVYQRPTGSFTAGEFRFKPGAAVEVPAEVAAKLDPERSPDVPVKFFASPEKANEEVARLKKVFDRKPAAKQ